MKYVVAFYKNLLNESASRVAIGAVVTDGKRVTYDFDTSNQIATKIGSITNSFDPLVFGHFKETFTETFIKTGYAVTTDDAGERHKIPVTSDDFLDYLSRNSQSAYQYSPPRTVEASDPEQVLAALMSQVSQAV